MTTLQAEAGITGHPCEAPERFGCESMATHLPCCSVHGKRLCCKHYNDFHFVEVDRCAPPDHQEKT